MPVRTPLLRNTVAVALLALIVRLVYFLIVRHGALIEHDSSDFIRLTAQLAHGRYSVPGAFSGGFPLDLNRPPGYPAFLLAANGGGHVSAQRTALVQVFLGAAFAGGLTYVVGRWLDPLTGLVAGVMMALDWSTLINTPLVLTDVMFAMLYACGLALFAVALLRQRWSYGLPAGLVLGVATLVKPIGLFGLLVVAIAVLFRPRRHWRALACVVTFALVVVPWAVRNDSRYGVFTVSTIGTVNLYSYTAQGILHGGYLFSSGVTGTGSNPANRTTAALRELHLTTAQLSSRMNSQAIRVIRQHLPKAVVQELWGALHVMFGTGKETLISTTGDRSLPSPVTSWLPLAQILVMWALTGYGITAAWRRRVMDRGSVVLLVAGIAVMILAAGGPAGYGRYRLPATPLECVLAAVGAVALVRRSQAQTVGRPPSAEPPS